MPSGQPILWPWEVNTLWILPGGLHQWLCEQLYDMKPVNGGRGKREDFLGSGQESFGHVTDNLDDVVSVTPMFFKEFPEFPNRCLALAGHGKDDGLCASRKVDEYSDIVMAPLRGRFVKAESLQGSEIDISHGLPDIEINDSPQTLIGDFHNTGSGKNGHLPDNRHGSLLKQQGELTALSGPRRLDSLNSMVRAIRARYRSGEIILMLKKIEMAPGEFFEIMGLAHSSAVREG
jgi:hypothetical protein